MVKHGAHVQAPQRNRFAPFGMLERDKLPARTYTVRESVHNTWRREREQVEQNGRIKTVQEESTQNGTESILFKIKLNKPCDKKKKAKDVRHTHTNTQTNIYVWNNVFPAAE